MDAQQLKDRFPSVAFAFQGYDLATLGRSRELLAHPQFGPVVETYLARASAVCNEFNGKRTDLRQRILGRFRRARPLDLC